ncbi:MAG: DoxX family protein [Planctomycetes bacterium]|nr:DoxX family protein [Planctomycetota bacterium]
MTAKTQRMAGWILTGLVGLFLIAGSGIPKFLDWPGKTAMMTHLGLPLELVPAIGALEIAVTLLYLIPRTAFLGAILLTGYLGGALFTHLRIGDPWFFPLIVGVLAWAGLALRRPLVFQLVLGARQDTTRHHAGQP